MQRYWGIRAVDSIEYSSYGDNPDDDNNLVFPRDFVVEREDIPVAGGIWEGSGTILFRAYNHWKWSVFELRGNWMDDELHGKASLYHNTHLLFTASFVYGVMYFKREQCDGILITPSGCKPIRSRQRPRTRSMKFLETRPSETDALVVSDVPVHDEGEEVNEEEEKGEEVDEESKEVEREEEDYDEVEDDDEVYEGVKVDNTPTQDIVLCKKTTDTQKQVKELYLLIANTLVNDIAAQYAYDQPPNRPTTLFLLSTVLSEKYMLETQVQNGIPNGFALLYSMRTLAPLCRLQFQLGVPTRVFLLKASKKASDYAIEVLDLSYEGERWEGEVRNLLPNGQGQFFNRDNVCVYEGAMVNGCANGLGTGFYPDLGTKAYFGHWKNNLRHGVGREFNRRGEFVRSGLWLNGSFATLETLPNDVNTPHLRPSSYCKLVHVMYLNDSALHNRQVNTVEGFPLLKALFLASSCVGESEWLVKDMPMLEKVVAGIRHDGYWCNHYIQFVNCPRLCELWTIVDFAHGTVFLQPEDSRVGRYDPKRLEESFEPRFVLGELERYMKWKRTREAKDEEELRYYKLDIARYGYIADDFNCATDVEGVRGLYSSGKESGYCAQLSAAINPQNGMSLSNSANGKNEEVYCFEGCLRPKRWSVCWNK